jgi:hypothetical protein
MMGGVADFPGTSIAEGDTVTLNRKRGNLSHSCNPATVCRGEFGADEMEPARNFDQFQSVQMETDPTGLADRHEI